MDDNEFREWYGWAELAPADAVVAGSTGTWTLTYHVGQYGIDDGGSLKIAWRQLNDWGKPQTDDPEAPNYLTVTGTGDSTIRCRFDPRGHVRPWRKALILDFFDEALAPGDRVQVVYGDTSGGSPGSVAQTFCEKTFEFRVLVDSHGGGEFVELRANPELEVIGGDAVKLVLIAPSLVQVGEPFDLLMKALDKWGNVAPRYEGVVRLDGAHGLTGLDSTIALRSEDGGLIRVCGITAETPGPHVISATDGENGLACRSNPILVADEMPEFRPYWGDLHGQSEETVGTNSVEDYFRYARDVSRLDISGHQGNAFQITKATWREICRCTREFNEPGRFVTFLGYEWSGNTPAGGDHNVYFLRDDEPIHRCSHWQIVDKSDVDTDRFPLSELYRELRDREAITVPHVGGRPANPAYHDADVEPLIEIYSAWGQFEWLLRDALERGYRVGFVAGSDDHKGRPGASYPGSSSFGVYGGLVCVYARELTREAVWEALRARRCYATSGQRILLDVRCGDCVMGGECRCEGPREFRVRVVGTDEVERIELFAGTELAAVHPSAPEREADQIRIAWGGALRRGRGRIATWDGWVAIENGRIVDARGYAFDSEAEGIVESTEAAVTWRSSTAGDVDGVILRVAADADASLIFESAVLSSEFSLEALREAPVVRHGGGEGLMVAAEYLPRPIGMEANVVLRDDVHRAGAIPYHVKVTQCDGACAWSSPIFVETA